MSPRDLRPLKQALLDAGIEIYGADERAGEIQIAERVRLHIMDSGIRVRLNDAFQIEFTVRSQQSDFPNESASDLLCRVRDTATHDASSRGYSEVRANTVDVKDPIDAKRVLDVWHEVVYEKTVASLEQTIEEVAWALKLEKYVGSS